MCADTHSIPTKSARKLESEVLRFYEAWMIEPDGEGGFEITDECGHIHDTLADAREHHRLHPNYNAIVALDYGESGEMIVAKEYRHNPRRPQNWIDAFAFDLNRGTSMESAAKGIR